jgi:hypothetical protein
MTALHIRQCPRCELRFTSSSELDYHLSNDHRPRATVDEPGSTPVAAPPPPPPPPPPSHASQAIVTDLAAASRSQVLAWVVALTGLFLVILAAWIASIPIALITAGLVLVLVGCYGWRHAARMRLLRRQPIRLARPVKR